MRLFIAISLNDEIRKTLVKTQDYLSRHGIRGSLTPRENLHMTLTFIGEHPDPDQVLEVMEKVEFSSFPIVLNDIGLFNIMSYGQEFMNQNRCSSWLSDCGTNSPRRIFHLTGKPSCHTSPFSGMWMTARGFRKRMSRVFRWLLTTSHCLDLTGARTG